MYEPDFWTNCADAMEHNIEGQRLIARDLQELARDLWNRMIQALTVLTQQRGHLPPV
jgi:hypothetical protein